MSDFTIPNAPITKTSRPSHIAARLMGVDRDTLNECPPADRGNIFAIGILMGLVWIYQSAVLSMLGRQILVPDGDFTPGIVLGAMTITTLIQQIDAYVFVRAGFYAEGLEELKRGGLDITPGVAAKIKAAFFLILRIFLALGFAALTAIFTSLVIFRPDLESDFDRRFQMANGPLIATARAHIDAGIHRATEAANAADAQVAALQKQVAAMRNGAVNPGDANPTIVATQDEITRLTTLKAHRADELSAAQSYANDELAGIKNTPGNSGMRGRGPVRIAAEERVKTAEANASSVDRDLQVAWTRLDDLRKQSAPNDDDRSRDAKAELPRLEADLSNAANVAAASRAGLAKLTARRNDDIRAEVANAPDCSGCDRGLVGQLVALERIAKDREIAAVILLIDIATFGLELAAVFARVTVFLPTTYAALLARNAYLRLIQIVDGMDEILDRPRNDDSFEDDLPPLRQPADDRSNVADPDTPWDSDVRSEPHVVLGFHAEARPKRPRGRPRKSEN